VRGQRHAPAALYPPGKIWYPLYRRLDRPQGRSGQVRKISPQPGFDPARSQSLYRLRYPTHDMGITSVKLKYVIYLAQNNVTNIK